MPFNIVFMLCNSIPGTGIDIGPCGGGSGHAGDGEQPAGTDGRGRQPDGRAPPLRGLHVLALPRQLHRDRSAPREPTTRQRAAPRDVQKYRSDLILSFYWHRKSIFIIPSSYKSNTKQKPKKRFLK